MNPKEMFQQIYSDPTLLEEFKNRVNNNNISQNAQVPYDIMESMNELLSKNFENLPELTKLDFQEGSPESIILDFGRPALLIRNDTFSIPESDIWKSRLLISKTKIENAIRSVGRIELLDHPSFQWIGTGWMVAENILVTNRHVALEFAEKVDSGKFDFRVSPRYKKIRAKIDFKEEYHNPNSLEVNVIKILYIEEDTSKKPDIAFLEVKPTNGYLPRPIPLNTSNRNVQDFVAVIGYPAKDSRNNIDVMARVFNNIYQVKRLQPGQITSWDPSSNIWYFSHDCSTLGGNSGSVVIDLETGEAIGLHFMGSYHENNYAVKADYILKCLKQLNVTVDINKWERALKQIPPDPQLKKDYYKDKKGYDSKFLKAWEVPLPLNGTIRNKLQPLIDGDPNDPRENFVLEYQNFSVVMNKDRKFAMYTASNIDGNNLKRVPRKDEWYIDPRIAKNAQIGNNLYFQNELDRGHITRRLDVVWGTNAKEANDDTFHYTNCVPQHEGFNKRSWRKIEDWILDNADIHNLRITVFTGPVFKDDDPSYRGIQIPKEFWKIIVWESDNGPSATAYLLSQSNLISDLLETFSYGKYKTYQVPITTIIDKTGIDFSNLINYDPMKTVKPEELISGYALPIEKFVDIKF
ncbi:MAG: DNA/RNA non-specific endonuclease [Candidatus Odinarchaeota archaeon]